MRKIGNICLLLGLVTYLYYYAVVEGVDCTTGAGYCNYGSNYLICYITNDDAALIKVLINNCSSQSIEFVTIYLYKSYYSTTNGELIIDIDLPSNIRNLYLYNNIDRDYFRLTTSVYNIDLTRIGNTYRVELESHNFFQYFLGLQYIYMQFVTTKETPSFTNLQFLTLIHARIRRAGSHTHAFDNTIVRGLSNLRYLSLLQSTFDSITDDAFDNLIMLTYLSLSFNEISFLQDGVFNELTSLKTLYLSDNQIKNVSMNVFEGLTDLTTLSVYDNPGFPIEALSHTKSLEYLYIMYNGYRTLNSYIFQQMNSLKYLYADDPFICDCELQWASQVSQYELNIYYGVCFDSSNSIRQSITNPELYANCTQTESYQCFDKSITCPSNEVCHNTEDSYFCSCPIGYSQHSSGECIDVDECEVVTDCEHSCKNTEGSYHCVCDEGYKLSTNGYDCDDVNECQEENGGCEIGCGNTVGSYQCYCEQGHQLYNETHCESDIQCDVIDSSGYQENRFICQGGFNLTISNLTCHSIPEPTTISTIPPTSCPIGYSLHNSGECKDFDECDEVTNCTYNCQNTEGSYHCVCEEGYKLATNGYDCEDANECQEWNGGCEFGCRNTIGSFLCYCEYGHQLINKTHCESDIQCDVVDSSGYQENRFTCQGGFNLTITNLTCQSIPEPTTASTETPTHCPIGFSLHNSGECKDFNECDEVTNCTYTCHNTEGSYHCVCEEGYKLSTNGYDCEDANECQEWNGGCQFGCRNSIGSFECYCEYGHQLINETHCEEGIECELMGESCVNELESNYYCKGGFNITIYNPSCPNVDTQGNNQQNETSHQTSYPTSPYTTQVMSTQYEFQWYLPTVILMTISLLSNVFLIFMFIALFLYFVRKVNKLQSILKAKETNDPRISRSGYNNETIYNCMDESAHPDELKKTSVSESELMEKTDPNILTEVYPGSVQDETVKYQIY